MAMLSSEMLEGFGVIDVFAVFWFMVCWVGYSVYSRRVVRRRNCLRGVMAAHRVAWMDSLLKRDNRVGDAALLATLERNVSFFASSTLLILAGLLTALGSGNDILAMVAKLPFHAAVSSYGWEAKLLVLVAVFMYAFFKFSWSLRQYGFAAVLMGRAPMREELDEEGARQFSTHSAKVISRAAHAFNLGLRAYYFSLAYLFWFINPWAFMLASAMVVGVLYRREFRSRVLDALSALV